MRINKLFLQNVKSFRDYTEIDFSSDINIFIGPNGGGKSNLINTLSWVLNSKFYRPYNIQFQNNKAVVQLHNYAETAPEPHWAAPNEPSYIWIEFQVTHEDIEGLRTYWRNKEKLKSKFRDMVHWEGNVQFDKGQIIEEFERAIVDPDQFDIHDGSLFRFKIAIDGSRRQTASIYPVNADDEKISDDNSEIYNAYLRYLTDTEIRETILSENAGSYLPYIQYSSSREPDDMVLSVTRRAELSELNRNYHNDMQNYVFNNKGSSKLITQIATLAIGSKAVELIYQKGLNSALDDLKKDEIVKTISEELERFGFRWELQPADKWSNSFQIGISNIQEESYFSIKHASSGERQLVNFILGLTSAVVENSLIIIDEPELNLHPRWQKLLLRFFLKIGKEKRAQFIISTHSASFLDEETLPHVRRIFRKDQSSVLSDAHAGEEARKIVEETVRLLGAQQNERIFFTQKAVLVEGPSDFVIWQKLINKLSSLFGIGDTIEVVEVLGSSNFSKYQKFLNLFFIESFVIADQDYVLNVGDEEVKSIFRKFFKEKDACGQILRTHSLDKMKLISSIEEFIDRGDPQGLRGVLEYIKCRNVNIDIELLSEQENIIFNRFRDKKRVEGVFILKKGALEAYYFTTNGEAGAIKKDTEKAIDFVSDNIGFNGWMTNGARLIRGENLTRKDKRLAEESAEFLRIAFSIIGIDATPENALRIIQSAGRA